MGENSSHTEELQKLYVDTLAEHSNFPAKSTVRKGGKKNDCVAEKPDKHYTSWMIGANTNSVE